MKKNFGPMPVEIKIIADIQELLGKHINDKLYVPVIVQPNTNSLNRIEHERMMDDMGGKNYNLITYMSFANEMRNQSNKEEADLYTNIFRKLYKENEKKLKFLVDQSNMIDKNLSNFNNDIEKAINYLIQFFEKNYDYIKEHSFNLNLYDNIIKYRDKFLKESNSYNNPREGKVLFTNLFLESIVEEYSVDEGIRDMAKKGAAIAAFGAASTIGAYNIGKNLVNKKEVPQKVQQIQAPEKKELTPHAYMLLKQAYAESRFNPKAESPKGAKGLTQIMPSVLKDYMKRLNKNTKEKIKIDLNKIEDAIKVQVDFMSDLYNRGFIKAEKKGQPEEVRIAKTLAAYNYGPKNLFIHLQEKQKKGVDIYKSLEWMEGLPKETIDYINKVSPEGKNSSFNSKFEKAIESGKYENIIDPYRKVNNLKK